MRRGPNLPNVWKALALLPIISVTAAAVLYGKDLQNLETLGYFGVFVANIVASGTFVLPLPGLAVAFGAAALFNPVLVALAGSTGSTLGEMAGYAAGTAAHSTARNALERRRWYALVQGFVNNHGAVTIFLLAATPNPLFDVAGFAAGSLGYPAHRFALACWTGKTLKFLVVALAGSWAIPVVASLFGL